MVRIDKTYEFEQDIDVVAEHLDAPNASKPPTNQTAILKVKKAECIAQVNAPLPVYIPPGETSYRNWSLRNPEAWSWSAVRLFLLFFSPILVLLVLHTNIAAQREATAQKPWKPVTFIEMRRWVACKLDMVKHLSNKTHYTAFWAQRRLSTKAISQQRYKAIERYICLDSSLEEQQGRFPWFWKVKAALDALRQQLKMHLLPSSHVAVDEITIKFHGHKKDLYKMDHKPAQFGILLYGVTSHGGLLHDFLVASSEEGLEGVKQGISIDLSTRDIRNRYRGDTGQEGSQIHLPMLKSVVYVLLRRLTEEFQTSVATWFICFVDNLFVDVFLAKALLTIKCGICGTTRKNAPGVPSVMQAITHRFPKQILGPNASTSYIVDGLVNVTSWFDNLRGNVVLFITTAHRPDSTTHVMRRTKAKLATRAQPTGYNKQLVQQPKVAVEYNNYMNSTDHHNHLRAMATVRRAGQKKWTKKIIEFIIDVCQTNAYLIWRRNRFGDNDDNTQRWKFLEQLIEGLLQVPEKIHTPTQRPSRSECKWKGCRPRGYKKREPLSEIVNQVTTVYHRKTEWWCKQCQIALCLDRNCFSAYHAEHGLLYSLGDPPS